jgi:hypothetical protein
MRAVDEAFPIKVGVSTDEGTVDQSSFSAIMLGVSLSNAA